MSRQHQVRLSQAHLIKQLIYSTWKPQMSDRQIDTTEEIILRKGRPSKQKTKQNSKTDRSAYLYLWTIKWMEPQSKTENWKIKKTPYSDYQRQSCVPESRITNTNRNLSQLVEIVLVRNADPKLYTPKLLLNRLPSSLRNLDKRMIIDATWAPFL